MTVTSVYLTQLRGMGPSVCTHGRPHELAGHWPLFRFDPRRAAEGKNPMQLDSRPPSVPLEEYLYNETRYTMLRQSHPEGAKKLLEEARQDVADRWKCMKPGRA